METSPLMAGLQLVSVIPVVLLLALMRKTRPAHQQLDGLEFNPSADTSGTMPLDYATHGARIVCLHKDPLILMINDFLTDDACDEIIRRSSTDLRKSPTKKSKRKRKISTHPEFSLKRDSEATWFNPQELRGVVQRMRALAPDLTDHVGAQRVVRYNEGGYFRRHKDSFVVEECYEGDKCVVACEQRIAIIFCYLNTCETGGETFFTDLNLPPLQPVKGRAIIHFPVKFPNLDIDPRVYHEGMAAGDTKWLLTSWWSSVPRDYIATTFAATLMHSELDQDGPRPMNANKLRHKGVGSVD